MAEAWDDISSDPPRNGMEPLPRANLTRECVEANSSLKVMVLLLYHEFHDVPTVHSGPPHVGRFTIAHMCDRNNHIGQ